MQLVGDPREGGTEVLGVNDGLMVISRPNAPTRATSSGRSPAKSWSAASRSSGRLPSMLPETSSMTMGRMG